MRKERLSSEQRKRRLVEFERSGLTPAAFARRHGVNYSTLRYWVKRSSPPPLHPHPTLIEVVQDDPEESHLEICLGKACRIEITDCKQAKLVAAIIRELEATQC